jgi:hypothetical protein
VTSYRRRLRQEFSGPRSLGHLITDRMMATLCFPMRPSVCSLVVILMTHGNRLVEFVYQSRYSVHPDRLHVGYSYYIPEEM